jgi:tRNA A-37 threonylcarbamoyl transferase component Bud32
VVVKQSLPRLRVAEEWLAKQDRILAEARGLELAALLTPGRVPRLVDFDEVHHAITLEAAPRDWRTWKEQLFDGTAERLTALGLGETLGTWHSATATDPRYGALLADTETFFQLRVEPYHLSIASRHDDLRARIEAVIARMNGRRHCVVHGDFSPKNVLSGGGDFWVLDFEVSHVGDPVFDVAFMLHHLILKAVHTGSVERLMQLAQAFTSAYRATAGNDVFDDRDYLAAHIGCLLLARVDGKSPAEYLTVENRSAIRAEGTRLLSQGRGAFDAFWSRNAQ